MSVAARLISKQHKPLLICAERKSIEFLKQFTSVIHANSKELLDDVFRLRFQVYCLERGFEHATDYPDGRERDEDDCRSIHFLVLYRPAAAVSDVPVGTVRLIMPRSGKNLPVLKLTAARERRRIDFPLESTAEVSRFAIAKAFRSCLERDWRLRHRAGTALCERAAPPLLTYGLLRAVVMMSATSGITHIVAMMEPALIRLLGRLRIRFQPIGGPVEHHGLRQPVWAAMPELVDQVKRSHPELWELAMGAGWRAPPPATGAPA
jgi:N-acyl amino acid synthase of PEP-CTERM/exosortase system